MKKLPCLPAVVCFLFAAHLHGAVLNLSPGADIKSACLAAEEGDEILLGAGEYFLDSEVVLDKGIALRGAGKLLTKIRARGAGYRLFSIANRDASLSSVALIGASSSLQGSSVYMTGGLAEDILVLDSRSSTHGGAVAIGGGAIRRVFIQNATSTGGWGGGIYAFGSALVENCLVTDSSASWGGGIYTENRFNGAILNSTFVCNKASNANPDSYIYQSTVAATNVYFGLATFKSSSVEQESCFTATSAEDTVNFPRMVYRDFRPGEAGSLFGCGSGNHAARDVSGETISRPSIGALCSSTGTARFSPAVAASVLGDSVKMRYSLPGGGSGVIRAFRSLTNEIFSVEVSGSGSVDIRFDEAGLYSFCLEGAQGCIESFNSLHVGTHRAYFNSASSSPLPPFASPETASTSLEEALWYLKDGGEAIVLPGEHVIEKEISVSRPATVKGENESSPAILKAAGTERIFNLNNAGAVLSRLVLKGSGAKVPQYGGGVVFSKGGRIEDSILEGFFAGGSGGAVFASGGEARILRTIVRNNQSGIWGGGVYCGGNGYCDIRHCLFYGNSAAGNWGSAVYADGRGALVNSTLFDNPVNPASQGQFCRAYAAFGVTNTIMGSVSWYNGGGLYRSCNLESGQDPGFADRDAKDYRLIASSNCIDAGDANALSGDETDIEGRTRLPNPDIGCSVL